MLIIEGATRGNWGEPGGTDGGAAAAVDVGGDGTRTVKYPSLGNLAATAITACPKALVEFLKKET